jgi:hypothetical protein
MSQGREEEGRISEGMPTASAVAEVPSLVAGPDRSAGERCSSLPHPLHERELVLSFILAV